MAVQSGARNASSAGSTVKPIMSDERCSVADCAACLTRPAPDATVCRSCEDQTAGHLRRIPWLTRQLDITLTRQARMGDRSGPRSTETPVYFDLRASIDLETFRADLARWAVAVADHRGVAVDVPTKAVRLADGTTALVAALPVIADLSRWLLRWNGAAAQHPDAADYVAEVAAMARAAERTIDRAPDMRCLGPCDVDGCEAWLYVPMHAEVARCPSPECEAEYRVEDRRAWLMEQATDQLLTAAQIADQLPWIAGTRIDRKLINKWASRDQITRYAPHPSDARQAPRFRVGEVVDRIRNEAADQASKGVSGAA